MAHFPLVQFHTSDPTLDNAFRIALGDIVSNIAPRRSAPQPDGLLAGDALVLNAGLDYPTPWVRDAAINIWNGFGLLAPEAARDTLLSLVSQVDHRLQVGAAGQYDQYWDIIIWGVGAWWVYLYSGEREFLALALEATVNTLAVFERDEFDPQMGLFRGAAVYADGIAAYPNVYADDSTQSGILDWVKRHPVERAKTGAGLPMFALSTNCLYVSIYEILTEMAQELDQPPDPHWAMRASNLRQAIQQHFWDAPRGSFRYLVDPFGGCDHQEGLGISFALLFNIATPEQRARIFQQATVTPAGMPCLWPTFPRYEKPGSSDVGRHSGTVWPPIQAFWAQAAARESYADLFAHELTCLAAHAVRDGQFAEIYHPESGQIYGGIQEGGGGLDGMEWKSCLRQTWSATGFLRMVWMGLCGMDFSPAGIDFRPLGIPGMTPLVLEGLLYRKMILNLEITSSGEHIVEFRLNGKVQERPFLAAQGEGEQQIWVRMG
jgi:hypothetical protein